MLQTSDPIDKSPTLPPTILGVFAYLDQVLAAGIRDRLASEDIGIGPANGSDRPHELRDKVGSVIKGAFCLMSSDAPLCEEMAAFRLYCRDDLADALGAAYGLWIRGQDRMALTADYAIRMTLLQWRRRSQSAGAVERRPDKEN